MRQTTTIHVLLFITILLQHLTFILSDGTPPDCPYPCLPPPASGVTNYPPPSPLGSFGYYPPPAGYVPYMSPPAFTNPAPPAFTNPAPPPPNPILPWFPFYFRTPPSPNSASFVVCHLGYVLLVVLAVALWLLMV